MTGAEGLVLGLSVLAGAMFGPWAMLVIVPAMFLVDVLQRRLRRWSLAVAIAGVVLGALRAGLAPAPIAIVDLASSRAAEGVVAGMPMSSGSAERVILALDRIQHGDSTWTGVSGRVLVYLPGSADRVNSGDRLYLVWSATPADELQPGYAGYLASQGVSGSAHAWFVRTEQRGSGWARGLTDARREISRILQEAIPGDAGALAAGIVTGDDSALSDEAKLWFRRTGTTHITAVSGQNVALLVGFASLWWHPARKSTRLATHVALILAIWLYVGMVGLEAPALRAAILATLMMLGNWTGRLPDPLTILALTLGGMALMNPAMTHQVGFLLSAAASWALCASVSFYQRPTVLRGAFDMLTAIMAANIATLPILLWTFGEWSPVSLLANLLLGPIMTVAFPASYVLAGVGFLAPWAVPWLSWIPAIPLDLSLAVVHRLAAVLPLLHLPVTEPGMVMLIALPCFGALILLSRDGERWTRRAVHAWQEPGRELRSLLAGAMAGGILMLASVVLFWP